MAKNILALIIIFIAISLMTVTTITMVSKVQAPDVNETPDLYAEHIEQENVQKPLFLGMNAIIIGVLVCILLAGISYVLINIRKFGGGM